MVACVLYKTICTVSSFLVCAYGVFWGAMGAENTPKSTQRYYIGAGIAKTALAMGKMQATYKDDSNALFAPGDFKKSQFKPHGQTAPVQLVAGTNINKNLRLDVSYLWYRDISWQMKSAIPVDLDDVSVYGDTDYHFRHSTPEITSHLMMFGAAYYPDNLIGTFKFRPYVGAGIGLGLNKLSNFVVLQNGSVDVANLPDTSLVETPGAVGVGEFHSTHRGAQRGNLVYGFEMGATYALTGRVMLDIFSRWNNLGRVETGGLVEQHYETWSMTVSSHSMPDWKERGTLRVWDIGTRLRVVY